MNVGHDQNERDVIRELAKKATDPVQRFVLPWRLNPDANSRRWEAEDAGCGCGGEFD
jgi:hypothetical protein